MKPPRISKVVTTFRVNVALLKLMQRTNLIWDLLPTQARADAFAKFDHAAFIGDREAQYNIGEAYRCGYVVAQDLPQAISWFHKAADQGHAQSQLIMARAYESDEVLPKDDAQFFCWLYLAASGGCAEAQFWLGSLYESALSGVEQDFEMALYWYGKAAKQGYPMADSRLQACFIADGTHFRAPSLR